MGFLFKDQEDEDIAKDRVRFEMKTTRFRGQQQRSKSVANWDMDADGVPDTKEVEAPDALGNIVKLGVMGSMPSSFSPGPSPLRIGLGRLFGRLLMPKYDSEVEKVEVTDDGELKTTTRNWRRR